MLLAACYTVFPDVRISNGAFAMSVMAILSVLLPLRGLSYTLMRRRPFLERVLILGRGPLAEKILREVAVRPYLGYEVTDVADEQLGNILEATHADRIIVALAERRARLPVRQLLDARINGSVVEDGWTPTSGSPGRSPSNR